MAAIAGVSAMSVSRALNGQPGVSAETAERIQEVARRIGFRPNALATSFRNKRTLGLVGMVVPDPYVPVYNAIEASADESMRQHGHIVVRATSSSSDGRERAVVEAFVERGVNAMLLVSREAEHSYLAPLIERGLSVVFVGGNPPAGVEASAVVIDHRWGARQAVTHLVQNGHSRIAVIAGDRGFAASERLAGYEASLTRQGLSLDPRLIHRRTGAVDEGSAAVDALLDEADPPTAIFSTGYLLTVGAVQALHRRRSDIVLVGFDGLDALQLTDPRITVVTQRPTQLGRHAARLLLEQLAGLTPGPRLVTVRPKLLIRGSDAASPRRRR
ncbi:LacI family DNA-binding transcriptional regulator [Kribbella sp. CA-294648]|uniref:LacI family DNA-binding transcriptional regulator n=1 Tax=Kribbella sp. CA-294648 TaxID=3239948 RepID=UPI003D8C01BF